MIPEFVNNPDPSMFHDGDYCVLDFETTGIEKGTALNPDNSLVLACWTIANRGKVKKTRYIFGNEYDMAPLLDDIAQCDFIVAQNAKFELQWLHRCGFDNGSKMVYDTLLADWVIGGNRWQHANLSMDAIAKRRGRRQKSKIISIAMKGGIDCSEMPRSLLLKYCLDDISTTHGIMQDQLQDMQGTRLLPIVYTRCLTCIPLADMERNGVYLDKASVKDTFDTISKEFAEVTRELDKLTGGLNMNSPKQKAEFIYDVLGFKELRDPATKKIAKTASGNPKTDKLTIEKLTATTDKQRQFKELKIKQGKLNAALTKTLDFFMGIVDEKDGLFYGEIKQGTTRTHRLSSAGRSIKLKGHARPKSCQFQNFPNQYKKLIQSRHPDWLLCEADGAQLEFRVAGHIGDDEQIKHDIANKEDIHTETMKVLVEAGEPELVSAPVASRRRLSKKHTFRPMYGGTSGSEAVQEYCKFFAEKYHELHDRQMSWALEAADKKFIETEWGMRYYFPDVSVSQYGYIKGKQKVFNYPIQALATAEIIPIALVFFWYRTKNMKLILINTVHDSVICEVPPNEIELFQQSAVQSFTKDVYRYLNNVYNMQFSVDLGVGMKLGSKWGVSAYSDDELKNLVGGLTKAGHHPSIDDGEIVVDVPNPYYEDIQS